MLKIRLQRIGRRNSPSYRVVVTEASRAARKGGFVELLGMHDVRHKNTTLDNERILHWLSKGVQVSDSMHNLLINKGVIEGKKRNVLPKKTPLKKESAEEPKKAPVAQAPQSEASEAPEMPADEPEPTQESAPEATESETPPEEG